MAFFNEIGAGRFNRALQKLLSMKGQPPARQLASEIYPVHPFDSGTENRFLEGWNRYGMTASLTGAAGQFSAGRMRNPLTSGIVAVIEKFSYVVGTAGLFMQLDLSAASLDLTGAALVSQRMDARTQSQKSSLINTSQLNLGVSITPTIFQGTGLGQTMVDVIADRNQELPVFPGDAFSFGLGNAAANFVFNCWWRERALEESERF